MQLTTTNSKGFAPTTITEAIQFSEMLAKSQMVPKAYQNKPEDIMVAIQWGYEIGLAPLQALQNISVINGKPSVYGDAAMALVQASPVCETIDEHIEGEGANLTAVCVAKRKGRNPVIARFSIEDAKRAGLWGKQGPWQAYPKRMLQMRARGFALRDAFPDVLKGLITAEEAQDYPEERDITPPKATKNPLDALAPPAPTVALPDPQQPAVELEEPVLEEVAQEPEGKSDAGAELEVGYPLMAPGKEEPIAVYQSREEWGQAYEDVADKTARAGKRPARERMTALKAFKDVNHTVMQRMDTVARVNHTAAYSKRIAALGATLTP